MGLKGTQGLQKVSSVELSEFVDKNVTTAHMVRSG